MRTTSSLESMNAVLRRSFPNHPHIYKFIDRLRLFEFSKSLDMLAATKSEVSEKQLQRRKKRDQMREDKIRKLTLLLNTNEHISPGFFLEEMAGDGGCLSEIFDTS